MAAPGGAEQPAAVRAAATAPEYARNCLRVAEGTVANRRVVMAGLSEGRARSRRASSCAEQKSPARRAPPSVQIPTLRKRAAAQAYTALLGANPGDGPAACGT
ncbi:hypothetical protein [Streptomyces griseorubiginosus]